MIMRCYQTLIVINICILLNSQIPTSYSVGILNDYEIFSFSKCEHNVVTLKKIICFKG